MDSFISFKSSLGIRTVLTSRISYFYSENGKSHVRLCDDEIERIYCRFNKLEETFTNIKMFRIHEKFLLNLEQELVFCPQTREVTLPDGQKLIVSRERKVEFMEKLLKGSKK